MGVVYRAEHVETHSLVALKTVRLRNENLLSGIRREIRALMRVRHPGVVRILAEGVADGVPWYAMELLEGATLRDHQKTIWSGISAGETQEGPTHVNEARRAQLSTVDVDASGLPIGGTERITRSQPLPAAGGRLSEALAPLKQLCEALAFLHGEGIVHRDLKPENVFLRPDHKPVLMDFGIVAQFSGSTGREVLEVTGLSTGTAGYMAPEQIHGERVDARADLYAVGCMLYEVVVGLQPFPGLTASVIQHHLASEPVRPSELVTGLPEDLEELILRLLEKRPRDRLGHANDVITILRKHCDAPPLGGPSTRDYLYRPELVGREEATNTLAAHLEAAREGRGGLILVGGESGVGKTSIAVEASRLAAVRGMQVKTGECISVALSGDRTVRAAPLHPLRELLQSLADRCVAEGALTGLKLLGARGKVLASLEPRLAQLPGVAECPDPPELPAEAARTRLFGSLSETLLAMAAERPLVLLIDDLQWADELTLSWLRALAPELQTRGLIVLGTFRQEELSPPLEELIDTPGVTRIELKRLAPEVVGAMIAEMLSLPEPPKEFIAFVGRHSEGNPFFIAEYLRAAVAAKYLQRDEDGEWHVDPKLPFAELKLPHTLRELVGRRLDGLPLPARRLCEAASVLGRTFDGDLPRQVAGLSDAEVVEALDHIIARTVFEMEEGGRLRFQHDKLREIAYSMIDPARLPELHGAAAHAILDRHAGELEPHLPSLAHHFEMAGEHGRAMEFLERTGDHALASAAYGDAADAFARALALDDRHGRAQPPRRRARWEHGLGKARFGLGDLSAAEAHTRAALEDLGHPLPSTRTGWGLALVREAARQAGHRLGLRRRARDPHNDLAEAAQAAGLITHRYYYVGDSIAMITASLKSVNLAEQADLGWQVPHSYSWLGYVVGLLRRHALARDYFERARRGAERRHQPSEMAFALTVEAVCDIGFGRFGQAERQLTRALELSGGDPQMRELTLTTLGHVEFYTGRVARALDRYRALGESARARHNQQHVIWSLFAQGRSLLALGQVGEAAPLFEEARRSLTARPELDSEIICLGLLALARLKQGDEAAARELALETQARIERSRPIGFSTVDGYDAAAEVFLALGMADRAARVAGSLRSLARLFPMVQPAALLRSGQAALLSGDSRGRRQIDKSAARARELGMPRDLERAESALSK
jgi:serine/threonine protein kinase/tetratricopeptide (TPR) repeat protein